LQCKDKKITARQEFCYLNRTVDVGV